MPQQFLEHASRGQVLEELGLTDQHIARKITGWVAAMSREIGDSTVAEQMD
ncbi:1-deoxy-D-xylulose-5-phosphate synthase [Mycobacteroides abscessus subsp. abscessus]|nr:1-deoxy-D-xylulose-5-phosphate synthase [Mycobacteroides abscessus subsp. abscessus]